MTTGDTKINEAMIAKIKKIEKLISEIKNLGGSVYCYDSSLLVLELPNTIKINEKAYDDEIARHSQIDANYHPRFLPKVHFDYSIVLNS